MKGWIGWVREEGIGRFLLGNKFMEGESVFGMLGMRFKEEI